MKKIKVRDFAFIWLFLCGVILMAGIVVASLYATRPEVYKGTDLTIDIYAYRNYFYLESDSDVNVEAASSEFFLIRNDAGDVIYGKPATSPLAWDKENYYKTGPSTISNGQWYTEMGDFTIHLTSENNMTLTLYFKTGVKVFVIFAIVFALCNLCSNILRSIIPSFQNKKAGSDRANKQDPLGRHGFRLPALINDNRY